MHQGLKQWACGEKNCDKAFKKYSSLRSHAATHHLSGSNLTKPEFICGVNDCGKIYSLKVNCFYNSFFANKSKYLYEEFCFFLTSHL